MFLLYLQFLQYLRHIDDLFISWKRTINIIKKLNKNLISKIPF